MAAALALASLAVGSLDAQTTTRDTTKSLPRSASRDSMHQAPEMRGMHRRFAMSDDMGHRGGEGRFHHRWRGPLEREEGGEVGQGFDAGGMRMGGRLGMRQAPWLRGITLSTEQESRLRAGKAKNLTQAKPLMLEILSARTDEQLARLNGDQKMLDNAMGRLSVARTNLDSLRADRSPTSDLRTVLTPEQQRTFDRNVAEGADGSGRQWRGDMRRDMRDDMRDDMRGEMRGERRDRDDRMGPGGDARGPRDRRPTRPPDEDKSSPTV